MWLRRTEHIRGHLSRIGWPSHVPDEGYSRSVYLMKVIPEVCTWWRLFQKCVPDEGYSRNAACALHKVSTFLLDNIYWTRIIPVLLDNIYWTRIIPVLFFLSIASMNRKCSFISIYWLYHVKTIQYVSTCVVWKL